MPNIKTHDPEFETRFFESVLRRDPHYATVVELLGGLYTRQGRIADGLKMDRKLVKLQPGNATARYNLACSLALSKRNTDALKQLREAVALGYRDLDWMQQDPDLEALKKHPQFQELIQTLKPALLTSRTTAAARSPGPCRLTTRRGGQPRGSCCVRGVRARRRLPP